MTATIKQCKCDPASWGNNVNNVCSVYTPVLILGSDAKIVSVCAKCYHGENCHKEVENHVQHTQQ